MVRSATLTLLDDTPTKCDRPLLSSDDYTANELPDSKVLQHFEG